MDDAKTYIVYCADKKEFNWRLKSFYLRYITFIIVIYFLLYCFNVYDIGKTLSILFDILFHFTVGFFTYRYFMKEFKLCDINTDDLNED
jgi:hypothetical protein